MRNPENKSRISKTLDGIEEVGGRVGGWIGSGVGNSLDFAGRALRNTVEGAENAWDQSAKWLYEHGRMRGLVSWEPQYFEQGVPEEIKDKLGVVSVSVPFKLDEEHYPAVRSRGSLGRFLLGDVLTHFDSDFPVVLLSYEDPHPEMVGDEVIRLEYRNSAVKAFSRTGPGRQDSVVWRMWMPGEQKIAVQTSGQLIEKEHADMTAGDVVDMLINSTCQRSNDRLVLYPRHLHTALRMMTEKSDGLDERWKLLDERLKFSKHCMKNRHAVVMEMRGVVALPGGDLTDLLDQIRTGQVTNWGSFLDAVDQTTDPDNLLVHPGGSEVAMVLASGQASAVRDLPERLREIPPSLLLSARGLKFMNTLLDQTEELIVPEMEALAGDVIKSRQEIVKYRRKFVQQRAQAWIVASRELESQRGSLNQVVRKSVKAEVDALRREIESQISGGSEGSSSKEVVDKSFSDEGLSSSDEKSRFSSRFRESFVGEGEEKGRGS